MPEGALERRLGRIEDQLRELTIQATTLATHMADLNGDVKAVIAEIGGAPNPDVRGQRDTIRWRLHNLENDRTAAQVAQSALRTAEASREQSKRQSWSVREKLSLFVIAALTCGVTLARFLGYGG